MKRPLTPDEQAIYDAEKPRLLAEGFDEESAHRMARMRANGHEPGTPEEQQRTLDETLTMMEWDAP